MNTVLMGCTHAFDSVLQVGSQHIARSFAKLGWNVWYLSAPITPLHVAKLGGGDVRRRFFRALSQRVQHSSGVNSYIPFSLIAPDGNIILNCPFVTENWSATMIPSISRLLEGQGLEDIDLLYVDNLSYKFLFNKIRHKKSVFRVMDVHSGFPGWHQRARKIAADIASVADLTVYSALGLEKYVTSLRPRAMHFLSNAVSAEFFKVPDSTYSPYLENISGPVVLYSGSIDVRFDFSALAYAALSLPSVSFVLAGPVVSGVTVPPLTPNVHFLGGIPHDDLPALLRSADVGIIPFDVTAKQDLITGIRPLKLYEYLAARLPVVSADWEEVRHVHPSVCLYDDKEGLVEQIQGALACEKSSSQQSDSSVETWDDTVHHLLSFLKKI